MAHWMISNRDYEKRSLGDDLAPLSYWVSADEGGDLTDLASWRAVSAGVFQRNLASRAARFPLPADSDPEGQSHVCLFIHGYNNDWRDAARRYQDLAGRLFTRDGLGECVLFTWPSYGSSLAYLPDRADAAASGPALATVLFMLYEWLAAKQKEAAANPRKGCRAKTSIIAHSMGNFVLQKAMQSCWTRMNQPLLLSLMNQVLLVGADVDNDLFRSGETVDKSDGDAMANLAYRITALYSGRDAVLGASAGLKHFGKRRLGRSGLDPGVPVPDNVWAADCSRFFPEGDQGIHAGYFENDRILAFMADILRGIDRGVLAEKYALAG